MNIHFTPILFCFLMLISLQSCLIIKEKHTSITLSKTLKSSDIFTTQFTGFSLYDPTSNTFLKHWNDDLLFTPSSNTKILTASACLSILSDSIPTFLFAEMDDTIHISPFGDPTFLHPDFPDQQVLKKLNKPVIIHFPSEKLLHFGTGWAWDDYQEWYQGEKNWLPLYGNELRVNFDQTLKISPQFFQNYISIDTAADKINLSRHPFYNIFNLDLPSENDSFKYKIPFVTSEELVIKLLEDTLHQSIFSTLDPFPETQDTLYNTRTVDALSLMMLRSDNFLAEQLLIVCARLDHINNPDLFREKLINSWGLQEKIRWVDGSGLSRYNLISPSSMVLILDNIYKSESWSFIQSVFPSGGKTGTIKNWYSGEPPYVFAKTGSHSNNHSLSGYIKTNSGKILIFSFMNNHFMHTSSDVKMEMQKILEYIRDHF